MIKNYLMTAWRVMLRQKGYSAINIAGLSIGIAATLIIMIYVTDEFGYDKFHRDADRVYRVGFGGRLQGTEIRAATSPAPLAEAMQKEIPEVAEVVRFGIWRTMPIGFGDKAFTEKRVAVADSNFFDFFAFPLVAGDPKTVLKGTNKIVITQSAAARYFGNEDPIGKILLRGAEKTATEVTGVVQDPPHNSHITFDMVLSSESWDYTKSNTQWTSNNIYTYARLHRASDISNVKKQLNVFVEQKIGVELEKYTGMSFKQFKEQGNDVGLFTQPMLDIHLKSALADEIIPNGNIQYLYIFSAIALFIILIACINFMNLSTARSANRAKEVGVRKTIGAMRNRLVLQFLAESMLYSIFSTIIALTIVSLALQPFNLMSGKNLDLSFFTSPLVIVAIIAFTIIIGLMAGSYPAFYLTSFKPTEVLKGKIRAGFKNSMLRNVLVVFQFMISIALIFGSIIVYQQLKFMQEKNLGFNKENVVNLLHTFSLDKNAKAFKNELESRPEFAGASFANNLPPNITWGSAFRKGGSEQNYLLSIYQVDYDHLTTMGYSLAQGRFFSRDFLADTASVILNEAAFKQMGFDKLDGQTVLSYNTDPPSPLTIVGVIKDFNFQSLRDNVKPMAMLLGKELNYEMAIRLAPGNTQAQIKLLESIFKKYAAGAPFEYSFLDQNFDALFREEQRMGYIILVFTVLAIGIACLGLFGLATYTAEQRAKEISIRKVMGASISQVIILLSKNFSLLVLLAFLIAAPLGWYFAGQWLEGFAFHVGVKVSTIFLAGAVALLIAMCTISFQAIKAARENPVNAMRE